MRAGRLIRMNTDPRLGTVERDLADVYREYIEQCGDDPGCAVMKAEAEKQLAALLAERSSPAPAPRCPSCDRVMGNREAVEQGSCNDCYGGAWSPA
jgi:hypothetical protein